MVPYFVLPKTVISIMKKTRGSTGNYNPQMGYNIKSAIIFYEALFCHDVVQISIHANMDSRNVLWTFALLHCALKWGNMSHFHISPYQFSMWWLVLVYWSPKYLLAVIKYQCPDISDSDLDKYSQTYQRPWSDFAHLTLLHL